VTAKWNTCDVYGSNVIMYTGGPHFSVLAATPAVHQRDGDAAGVEFDVTLIAWRCRSSLSSNACRSLAATVTASLRRFN
jgi:hypothetical protein